MRWVERLAWTLGALGIVLALLPTPMLFLALPWWASLITLAFVLPMLEFLEPAAHHVQALILAPTRELAAQVASVVDELSKGDGIRTVRLGRIRGTVRFLTEKTRDFSVPPDYDPNEYRARPPWLIGRVRGTAWCAWPTTWLGGSSGSSRM